MRRFKESCLLSLLQLNCYLFFESNVVGIVTFPSLGLGNREPSEPPLWHTELEFLSHDPGDLVVSYQDVLLGNALVEA